MKKYKNLKNLLYKWARNGPKLRIFAQAQISKKLQTVDWFLLELSIATAVYIYSLGSENMKNTLC